MKLDIQFRGLQTSTALRHHAERKLHASLSRFGQRIRTVEVRIGDVNGPKGGEDKYCRVTLESPLGTVSVCKGAEDPYAAVHLAVDRLERAMARRLERARSLRRRQRHAPRLAS